MTDRRLIDDLNRLIEHQPRAREPLPPAAGKAAIQGRGVGKPSPVGGRGGIASPLTEPDYTKRTWHPEVIVTSSDGVFTLGIEPIKHVEMTDADGAPVVIEYAAPPEPAP